ncbi:MAG: ribonuclease HII [Alphaproteobacteria bacterium]|nr:MAG: ribonuclease HII [Alphaproteobacteria bacterium]
MSFAHEIRIGGRVAGVDEAGRGPWAGPVVAAAVVLDPDCYPDGLNDSKQLTAERRAALRLMLQDCAEIGVGMASVAEIDSLNIHWATMLAMERAVAALPRPCGHVLVDGNLLPRWSQPATALVGGDALCLSIAAASIIAKTVRDAIMEDLCNVHPGYAWRSNKGYGTPEHAAGLRAQGPTPHHRQSFAPVREWQTLEPRRFRKSGD